MLPPKTLPQRRKVVRWQTLRLSRKPLRLMPMLLHKALMERQVVQMRSQASLWDLPLTAVDGDRSGLPINARNSSIDSVRL